MRLVPPVPVRRRRREPRAVPGRRAAARLAVGAGCGLFALLTVALSVAVETVKPEWRDPEYGHRLKRVRRWQAERPERPLVLVFGSSRAQMGVSPDAMGFPDVPGEPLVYNFGYRGAHPLGACLQAHRSLDDGVKPRAVVLLIAVVEAHCDGPAEVQFPTWGSRLSGADLRRFAAYTERPGVHGGSVARARLNPWGARREAVLNDLAPTLNRSGPQPACDGWERMDRYGWLPFPIERVTPEGAAAMWAVARAHVPLLAAPPGQVTARAVRDLAARCRAEGIALALVAAPESERYRALQPAPARAATEAHLRACAGELGAAWFAAPEHLAEKDFADGFHLTPAGAAEYSRWLADAHLKAWLAAVLK